MNIGFISSEYVYPDKADGGLANYLKKTGTELVLLGNEITIFVLSQKNNQLQEGKIRIILVKKNSLFQRFFVICLHFSMIFRFLSPYVTQWFAARNIAKAVWREHKKKPFSILQTSLTSLAPGYALSHNNKCPVICRISSYHPLWRSAMGEKRSLSNIMTDWFLLKQVIHADASFSPSIFLKDVYKRFEAIEIDLLRTPIEFFNEPMDESFYKNKLSGRRYLLFFGTLNYIKGADLIGPIIPNVIKKYPDILFVFIGKDSTVSSGVSFFQNILNNTKIPEENIRYYSAIHKSQLYPIIKNALGVVLPSRVDNYPNACLEALSCNVPVIGTDKSSLDEMIINGKTGFIAKNNDSESLYEAIEKLITLSPEQRCIMIDNIRNWIYLVKDEDRIGMLINYYNKVIMEYSSYNKNY